jgi:hypothetical protein
MLTSCFAAHPSRPASERAPQDEDFKFVPHAEVHRPYDPSKHAQPGEQQ